MHSPTPWTFKVGDGGDSELIEAADGSAVHYDTPYYPSGMATADAMHIVACVNRVPRLEAALRAAHAAVPGGQICTPQEVADDIRKIAADVGVMIED